MMTIRAVQRISHPGQLKCACGSFLTEDREEPVAIHHQRHKQSLLGNLAPAGLSRFVPFATFCKNSY
jgi:hypothetical protein